MNYQETLDWIHSKKANGRSPSKDRLNFLLEASGHPERTFPIVHLIGTNGKGSTLAYLSSIFKVSGYRVGSFSSPFIERFNERIMINQTPIPDEDLAQLASQSHSLVESLAETTLGPITEFELVTFLMVLYFHQKNVDVAIVEAGIGGGRDVTSLFDPILLICPSVGLDHQDLLGDNLEAIAREKIGALKPGHRLIYASDSPLVQTIFEEHVQALEAQSYQFGRDFQARGDWQNFTFTNPNHQLNSLSLQLLGQHQVQNASLALEACFLLQDQFPNLTPTSMVHGLSQTKWVGRTERLLPHLMLDGAHNEQGILALKGVLEENFAETTIHIIFAGLERKSIDQMLEPLKDYDLTVTTFAFPGARPLSAYAPETKTIENYKNWLDQAIHFSGENELFVVTGSLYFISQVRETILKQLD